MLVKMGVGRVGDSMVMGMTPVSVNHLRIPGLCWVTCRPESQREWGLNHLWGALPSTIDSQQQGLGFISPLVLHSSFLQQSQDIILATGKSATPNCPSVWMWIYLCVCQPNDEQPTGCKIPCLWPKDKRTGTTITHEWNLRRQMTLCCLYSLAHIVEANTIKSSWF